MGLSSLPTPSEGVLTLVLVNTAITISIVKSLVAAALRAIRLRPPPELGSDGGGDESASAEYLYPDPNTKERFRSRFKPVRFGRRRGGDCRVCLSRFEPECEVDSLPCGHVFHRACIERWLEYRHVTCPLCRSRIIPADDSWASF